MSLIRCVYVSQYGGYWRLTPNEFRQLCEGIISGDGYQLRSWCGTASGKHLGVMLRSRPRCCVKPRGWRNPMSTDPQRPLFHPLDWDAEAAQYHLEEVFGEPVVNA